MTVASNRWHLRDVGATLTCLTILFAMLAAASFDPRIAIALAAAVVLVIASLWFGIERTAEALLTTAVFAAPLTSVRPVAAISIITLSDVLMGVGFALLLPRLARGRPQIPRMFAIGCLVFLIASILPAVVSQNPSENLSFLARLVVAAITLPLLFAYWGPDFNRSRVLAWAYVCGTIFGYVVGIAMHTGISNREQGLTTHPNFLALTAQMSLALALFLYVATPAAWRWVVLVAASFSIAILISSGSRAGLITVAVIGVVYPLASRSFRATYFTIAAGLLTSLTLGRVLAHADEGSALRRLFVGTGSTTGSDRQRGRALDAGWADFLSHPILGGGFNEATLDTHNVYVEVAQGAGIIGLIGFVLILWSGIRTIFKPGRTSTLGYATLSYAIVGMLAPSLWDRLVWTVLALGFVASSRRSDPIQGDTTHDEAIEHEAVKTSSRETAGSP